MSGALISIVRARKLSDTEDNDYTSGELFERHGEVQLVNPDGDPCAIPQAPARRNEDYPQRYLDGSEGHQLRLIRRDLTVSLDYIGNGVHRELERWEQERARVLASPGFGRNSLFAWRPVVMNGTTFEDGDTATDSMGQTNIQSLRPGGILIWDQMRRMMVKEAVSNDLPIVHTPGGGGAGFSRSQRNLQQPGYPKGATEGHGAADCGWTRWGTDATQLTLTHQSGGFGHPLCPDSLRVDYTDDVSSARGLGIQGLWDNGSGDYGGIPLGGAGTGFFTVWLKGRMPDGAQLRFGPNSESEAKKVLDLAGAVFDGWTPVTVAINSTVWTSATGSADLCSALLRLYSTDGVAGYIEVGPSMMHQSSGLNYAGGGIWVDSTGFSGAAYLDSAGVNFTYPENGTVLCSFFVPEDYHGSPYNKPSSHGVGLFGSASFGVSVLRADATTNRDAVIVSFDDGSSTYSYTTSYADWIIPGKVNTVAYSVGNGDPRVYGNGALIGTIDLGTYPMRMGLPATDVLWVGRALRGGSAEGTYPCSMLTLRVDEGAMSTAEVLNNHLALVDPIALSFAQAARGRVYQISAIPQTVLDTAGGSGILGNVGLRQIDYLHYLADPMNREANVP